MAESEQARFSRRLVIHEAPAVAKELERLAVEHGHSVAAEVRAAVRERLAAESETRTAVR
jgi:plasmid stability protein